MPSPSSDYRPARNPRYTPRELPAVCVSEAPKPQLVHDASYAAALSRAHHAGQGEAGGDGLFATDWRQYRVGAKAPPARPLRMSTLADRVLDYLNREAAPITWGELRGRLGDSAATIACVLARTGKLQRRRFYVRGRSGNTSQFLALGRIWPRLPDGAHGVIYDTAGIEEGDHA